VKRCLVVPIFLLTACFPYFKQIEKDKQTFLDRFPNAHMYYESGGRRMHYVRAGQGRDLIVFVHGSPGSWDAFARFLMNESLLSRARVISFDRPGFGESGNGTAELSLERQAALIAEGVRLEQSGPAVRPGRIQPVSTGRVILVGHSFGGPVIARMAMDRPLSYHALVFVAASVDPDLETVHWYQKAGNTGVVRFFLPAMLDVTNQEILPLRSELLAMIPLWQNIKSRSYVIQGGRDDLVPPGNADFLEKNLRQVPLTVVRDPAMDHFVPWAHPDLIEAALLDALAH
jgi:pimeloyl-ACP methyl ester carboxylesterase